MVEAVGDRESFLDKAALKLMPLTLTVGLFMADPAVARTTAFDTQYIEECSRTINDPKCGPAMRKTLSEITGKLRALQNNPADRAEVPLLNQNASYRDLCMKAADLVSGNMKDIQSVGRYLVRNIERMNSKPGLSALLAQLKQSEGFKSAYPSGGTDQDVAAYLTAYISEVAGLGERCNEIPGGLKIGIGQIFSKKVREGTARVRAMQTNAPAVLAQIIELFESDPNVEKEPAAWSALILLRAMRPPER